uniref:Uncharacterized protein n=1 Tax=Tetranychus urticae TaxID=32264 RepID=T1KNA8_TETUR
MTMTVDLLIRLDGSTGNYGNCELP